MSWLVSTFYKFVSLPDCAQLRQPLLTVCQAQGVKGTIVLAPEGINATIAGAPVGVAAVISYLRQDPRLADLSGRESAAETAPFARMKVKLKREIISLGSPTADPTQQVGTYVQPQQWNQIITDPDVVVVDTRNDYEVSIGSFQGAHNPGTRSFREFPDYVEQHLDPSRHKKVAMFCTGGIRCEKASAYLLQQGFETVYHLQGGILQYLEAVPPEASLWEGECFVFDERVAVQHGLGPGTHSSCLGCGHPLSAADQASPHYEAGIACPYCHTGLTPEQRSRRIKRQHQ